MARMKMCKFQDYLVRNNHSVTVKHCVGKAQGGTLALEMRLNTVLLQTCSTQGWEILSISLN